MVKIRKIGGSTKRCVLNMVLQAFAITTFLLLVSIKNGFSESSEQRLPLPPSDHGTDEDSEASIQGVRPIPTPNVRQGIEQSPQVADSFSPSSAINPYFTGPPACHGFFTVLANAWIPDEATSCNATYQKFEEQLMVHNQQLLRMNSTMKIFTTWTPEQLQEPGCHLNQYPALEPVQFDPEQILLDHGFTNEHVDWLMHWGNLRRPALRRNHLVARLSDVFRIVLGMKYSLAYADLDMVYLSDDATIYLQVPNVAVPIWQEEKGAFEIQNSGFCFTRPQLQVLLNDTLTIVQSKGPDQIHRNLYFYTELGPNLFQHALQAMQGHGPIRLYYTMCDNDWSDDVIVKKHQEYHRFVWLHYDKSIRRINWYKRDHISYLDIVQIIREKVIPPTRDELFPPPPSPLPLAME